MIFVTFFTQAYFQEIYPIKTRKWYNICYYYFLTFGNYILSSNKLNIKSPTNIVAHK